MSVNDASSIIFDVYRVTLQIVPSIPKTLEASAMMVKCLQYWPLVSLIIRRNSDIFNKSENIHYGFSQLGFGH